MRLTGLILGMTTCALAGAALAEAPADGFPVEWAAREITGVVVFSDGETPVRDLPVKIWSLDRKKMIYRSRTDQDGGFRVPRVTDERCYLFVGQVKINMRFLSGPQGAPVQDHDVVVALSRPYVTASAPTASPQLLNVLIAPALMRPPDAPSVVSP